MPRYKVGETVAAKDVSSQVFGAIIEVSQVSGKTTYLINWSDDDYDWYIESDVERFVLHKENLMRKEG